MPAAAPPDELVGDAAHLLREKSTSRFTLSYTRTRADRPDDPERYAECEGALDLNAGRGRLRFELDTGLGGGIDMPFELRWAREWIEATFSGRSTRLARARVRESGGLIGRLPDEPEALVELLASATDARSDDTETLSGNPTTVVRFVTDAREAGRSGVPPELHRLAAAGRLGTRLPMEAWIAVDGLPMLVAYEVRLPPQRHRGRVILPARTVRGGTGSRASASKLAARMRRAGRVTAGRSVLEADAVRGKSGHRRAGRWGDPGGESRRKVEQKGDRRPRSETTLVGKGETVR